MLLNTTDKIQLTVLTPLSIGRGAENDWMKGLDYISDKGSLYILDVRKMIASGIDCNRLTYLFLNNDTKGIERIIGNKLKTVSKYIFAKPDVNSQTIKTFVRSQLLDKPIITGSSLKGAIRSVLFKHLKETNDHDISHAFGNVNEGADFLRFLKVSDFEMNDTSLVNTKIFNLRNDGSGWKGGWKGKDETTEKFDSKDFNTLYECVMPQSYAVGKIAIAYKAFELHNIKNNETFQNRENYQRLQALIENIQNLFNLINNHTREYLHKELKFFEHYDAENSDKIIDSINDLLSQIPSDGNSCVLKMSAGSGFHSVTGDYRFNEYISDNMNRKADVKGKSGKEKSSEEERAKNAQPKSRKIAIHNDNFSLMGFVKLSVITDEQYSTARIALQEQHEDYFRKINLEYYENKANEELLNKKLHDRDVKYKEAIGEAEKLYNEKEYDNALEAIEKAKNINPTGKLHDAFLEKINKAKRVQQDQIIGNAVADLAARQQENIKRRIEKYGSLSFEQVLSMEGELSFNILEWSKLDGHQITEADFTLLLSFIKQFDKPTKRSILKKNTDFKKFLSKEQFNRFNKELR